MRGVGRLVLFGFLIFTLTFDLLILAAVLHGSNAPSSISPGPIQTQPQSQPIEYDYTDFFAPPTLVEQPFISTN
jgi:hypothetical protein